MVQCMYCIAEFFTGQKILATFVLLGRIIANESKQAVKILSRQNFLATWYTMKDTE